MRKAFDQESELAVVGGTSFAKSEGKVVRDKEQQEPKPRAGPKSVC